MKSEGILNQNCLSPVLYLLAQEVTLVSQSSAQGEKITVSYLWAWETNLKVSSLHEGVDI